MTKTENSRKIWGWMWYDWAAQPFNTLMITFIFAPYFTSAVVGDPVAGQSLWGVMTGIVGLILAISAPIMGAYADNIGPRKPWMLFFSALYVFGCMALWWAVPGSTAIVLILCVFAIGYLGMELSQVFVNAMLPDLGPSKTLGRISANGWAFGYIGGILTLFIMLLFLGENDKGVTLLGQAPILGLDPEMREGTRAVGPLTALWYLVFIIPFFMWVPDRKIERKDRVGIGVAMSQLKTTIASLPKNISLGAFLLSSMFYRDALIGIFAFGGIFASGVLEWDTQQLGIFGIVASFGAIVFTFIGGFFDQRFGSKPVITYSVLILIALSVIIIGTSRTSFMGVPLAEDSTLPDRIFMVCGAILGGAGGVLQASSRAMMARQAEPGRMTEAFGIYALSGKATAFLAPSSIALVTYLTQNQRLGLTPVIVLFLIGLCLLFWVDPKDDV